MPARKYSASMDDELLSEVEAAAGDEGTTVSAWIAEAVRHRLGLLGLARLIDDWEAAHGAFTEEELAEAERWFDEALSAPSERERRRVHDGRKRSA